MARAYTISNANVSISSAIDIVSLTNTSSSVFEVDEMDLGQVSVTTVGNLRTSFKRFSGAFTPGSGGTAPTPAKHVNGDNAAAVGGRSADTTQTTGGTSVQVGADAINVINGYQKLPAPEDRWSFTISQAFVWSLDQAPNPAESMSMQVTFRETV
jgi:hypothetical protein